MEMFCTHKQHNTTYAAEEAITSESQESSTPVPYTQQLQFLTEDIAQTAPNFYIWQLYQNSTLTPIYPVAEPPTTILPAPTEDDMNTVEKVDTKLLCMEQYWAKS